MPLNCCRAAGPQGEGGRWVELFMGLGLGPTEQLLGPRQALLDRGITHFGAVWDDKEHTYVFVASIAPNWLGHEEAWTIRPAARSMEVTEGAPAAWDGRPWKQ